MGSIMYSAAVRPPIASSVRTLRARAENENVLSTSGASELRRFLTALSISLDSTPTAPRGTTVVLGGGGSLRRATPAVRVGRAA